MFRLKLLGGASIETSNGPLTGRAAQRHRIALLAVLAVARSGGVTRDRLIAYLWPETDTERGRRLLADSVYRINQALGEDAVLTAGDELRLDPRRLPSDLADFEEALAAQDAERAAALYTGPLLDGFFLPASSEFEHWVDGERGRLARAYAGALESLAVAAEERNDHVGAVRWWRTATVHDRYNSRITLHLMRALVAAGERAAALQHARVFELLLRDDLGVVADPEVAALAESLRRSPARENASEAADSVESPREAAAVRAKPPGTSSAGTETFGPGDGLENPAEEMRDVSRFAKRTGSTPLATSSHRGAGIGVGLALLAALTMAALWLASSTRQVPAIAAGPTIAVLPFSDLSAGGDYGYFADGMTEELINTLSRVEGLRVASRTSAFAFSARGDDVLEIGRRLGVATVLEGSVRRDADRLRITAQLVDATNGYQLWSETYDREQAGVFEIQEDITRAIVETLKGRLIGGEDAATIQRPAVDPEAYNLYLEGRYYWHRRTKEDLRRAADAFERATLASTDYAPAWVGLADAYAVLGFYDYLPPRESFPRAEAAARQALRIEPDLAEAHATLGYVALYFAWNWQQSETEFRRAIALAPAYSTAHQWYANFLTAMGRFDEAELAMRRAQELDPLSLIANAALGWVYYLAGDYQAAIEQCRHTLELDASFELAHYWIGLALEELGRLDEAVAAFERAVELSGGSDIIVAALARSHALGGRTTNALALVRRLQDRATDDYVPAYELAKVYLALDRKDDALAWLERAFEQRSHSMAFLRVDPQLAALRHDARFQDLGRRVGH